MSREHDPGDPGDLPEAAPPPQTLGAASGSHHRQAPAAEEDHARYTRDRQRVRASLIAVRFDTVMPFT